MNKILVFVGPSGAGKTSLMKKLRKLYGAPILYSYTTRPRRPWESDGDDYKFVSKEEMDRLDLFEHVEYAGHVYGTPRSLFEDALRKHPVSMIAMNLEGAKKLKAVFGDGVSLILLTMPLEIRRQHLVARDGAEAAEKRLRHEDAEPQPEDADFDFVLPNNGTQWKKILNVLRGVYFTEELSR